MIRYAEPKKVGPVTVVTRTETGEKTVTSDLEFNSMKQAWEFLRTMNLYVNGKLIHTWI